MLRLLYIKRYNTFVGLNKKDNIALRHQQERELDIAWHADLEVYGPIYSDQQLKDKHLKCNQFFNMCTSLRTLLIQQEKAKQWGWCLDTQRYTFKYTEKRQRVKVYMK